MTDYLEMTYFNDTNTSQICKFENERTVPYLLKDSPSDLCVSRFEANTTDIPLFCPNIKEPLRDFNLQSPNTHIENILTRANRYASSGSQTTDINADVMATYGNYLAIASHSGKFGVFDMVNYTNVWWYQFYDTTFTYLVDMKINNNGTKLIIARNNHSEATGELFHSIHIYNLITGQLINSFVNSYPSCHIKNFCVIDGVGLSSTDTFVYCNCALKRFIVYNYSTGAQILRRTMEHFYSTIDAVWDENLDGVVCFSGNYENKDKLYVYIAYPTSSNSFFCSDYSEYYTEQPPQYGEIVNSKVMTDTSCIVVAHTNGKITMHFRSDGNFGYILDDEIPKYGFIVMDTGFDSITSIDLLKVAGGYSRTNPMTKQQRLDTTKLLVSGTKNNVFTMSYHKFTYRDAFTTHNLNANWQGYEFEQYKINEITIEKNTIGLISFGGGQDGLKLITNQYKEPNNAFDVSNTYDQSKIRIFPYDYVVMPLEKWNAFVDNTRQKVNTNLQMRLEYHAYPNNPTSTLMWNNQYIVYQHDSSFLNGLTSTIQAPYDLSRKSVLQSDFFKCKSLYHFSLLLEQTLQKLFSPIIAYTNGQNVKCKIVDGLVSFIFPPEIFDYSFRIVINTELKNILGFHTVQHEYLENAHVIVIKNNLLQRYSDRIYFVVNELYRPSMFFPFKSLIFTSSTIPIKPMKRYCNVIPYPNEKQRVITDLILNPENEEQLYDLISYTPQSFDRKINVNPTSDVKKCFIDCFLETPDNIQIPLTIEALRSASILLQFS